ncbi:MAG TPA: SAM-dependent methyltransferase [Ktedonobacteraceae bacterium]|nr:SAM-dependent methyltransferase [Ktedonobacteraceae bacterium]
MTETYQEQIKRIVLNEETFVRLTMKGKGRDKYAGDHKGRPYLPWRQVIVRPVFIKKEWHLQFSYFTEKQDITKNYRGSQADEKLDEILALPFNAILVQTTDQNLHVTFTKKGAPVIHTEKLAVPNAQPDLAHDTSKKLPLPADRPDPFLQAVGIMDDQGKIRPSMHGKFSQINEFLKLLEHTGELEQFEKTPVNILDCGCGSAYLSFAAYHYLNDVRGIPARLMGIDVNEMLIEKDNKESEHLAYTNACFQRSSIIDYQPDVPPDIVLALHACDTATDEAIAQGIRWQSRLILCAPCCHHHLQQQLQTVEPFAPVFRHGILKQRMGDMLTDAFRALILRMLGYKTDVVEFVSPEHTDKNLLIRAVKRAPQDTAQFVEEYLALKRYWRVTPYLETLLSDYLPPELVPQSAESSRT